MRAAIARRFLEIHPEEAAAELESRPLDEVAGVLESCSPEVAAGVLRRMRTALSSDVLVRLPVEHAAALLGRLPHGDASRLLRGADAGARDRLLAGLARQERDAVAALLSFPEGSAGALMDPRVASLPGDLSAAQAAERLRAEPAYGAYYLYVVDREQRLVGVLNYRDLVRAEPSAELSSFMRPAAASIGADTSGEELLNHPGWRGFLALPVLDEHGVLLGALRLENLPKPGRAVATGEHPVSAGAHGNGLLRRVLGWRRRRAQEER